MTAYPDEPVTAAEEDPTPEEEPTVAELTEDGVPADEDDGEVEVGLGPED